MGADDATPDPRQLLSDGIAALQAGNLPRAQSLLKRLVLLTPRDPEAWWWLAQSLPDLTMRADCYRRVLAIDPLHKGARAMLQGASPAGPFSADSPHREAPTARPAAPSQPERASGPAAPPAGKRGTRQLPWLIGVFAGLLLMGVVLVPLLLSGSIDDIASSLLSFALPGHQAEDRGPAPAIALPETWTPTTEWTPRPPTATSASQLLTLTPEGAQGTQTYEQRLLASSGEISRARSLTADKNYAEAVLAWDQVLRHVPEYGEGYYQRARVNLELSGNQRIRSEYQSLLHQALDDIDAAIDLAPVVTGDFYYTRFQILDWLATDEPYFVDRKQVWLLALDNLNRSLAMGNSFPYSERALPFLYAVIGQWRKGLDEGQRLVRARGPSAPPSCDLNTALAENYEVADNYVEALKRIDIAIGVCPTYRASLDRAWILYNMGRLSDARAQLDRMIEEEPAYGGERYFIRALISYDEGKLDSAQTDLLFGSGQTWSTEGIYAYLSGRFALADDDTDLAIELLRYAHATLGPVGNGPLKRRIARELASLGSSPQEPTPRNAYPATPMPTLAPSITPRPLPASIAPTPEGVRLVEMAKGTGPLLLRPDDFPTFRFQPSSRIVYDTIESLTVYLISSSPQGIPTLQLSPWDPAEGGVGLIDNPVWGANPVRYPERYLTPGGDFFLEVHNWGDKPVQIDNLGVIIVVRQKDGTRSTFGLGEN